MSSFRNVLFDPLIVYSGSEYGLDLMRDREGIADLTLRANFLNLLSDDVENVDEPDDEEANDSVEKLYL
jgi:hypothetical protein